MTRPLPEIDISIANAHAALADLHVHETDIENRLSELYVERAKAQMPPEPPELPVPVVSLQFNISALDENHPTAKLRVVADTVAVPKPVSVMLGTQGAPLSVVFEPMPPVVIPELCQFVDLTMTVTEFPPFGETQSFRVYIASTENATFDASDSFVDFTVSTTKPPPPPPQISLWAEDNHLLLEEEGGSTRLTASISEPATADLVVPLAFTGSATFGNDYTCPASITIPAGQQTASVDLMAIGDTIVEGDESIIVTLQPPTGYEVFSGSVNLTIVDDDRAPDPPPVDPTDPPAVKKVRLYWHEKIAARLAAAPWIQSLMVKQADGESTAVYGPEDRLCCCAAFWLLGINTAKYTAAQHRDRAITTLMKLVDLGPINPSGNHYAINHLRPISIGLSWLREWMTPEQISRTVARIEEFLHACVARKHSLGWDGYNGNAGTGMIDSLAIYGDTKIDWVAKFWKENWWTKGGENGKGGFYNRPFERDNLGLGNHEDTAYHGNQITVYATRMAWEAATGDRSLDYDWLNHNPLLLLHQSQITETRDAAGKLTGGSMYLMPSIGGWGNWATPGHAFWLAAGTGSNDSKVASLSAWMLARLTYSYGQSFNVFFWNCIAGDPRVTPQSPDELGIAKEFSTTGTGFYFNRTGWDRGAMRVSFCASRARWRATGDGDVQVWAGGAPLVASRSMIADHGYCGLQRMTLPTLLDLQTNKVVGALGGDDTPDRNEYVTYEYRDGWVIADTSKLWPGLVKRCTRAVRLVDTTFEVQDEWEMARDGYAPMATWGTPLLPVLNPADGSYGLTNGNATGSISFGDARVQITGGEVNNLWMQDLDGTITGAEKTVNWQKLSPADRILKGGYYTINARAVDVGERRFRLGTTVRVSF